MEKVIMAKKVVTYSLEEDAIEYLSDQAESKRGLGDKLTEIIEYHKEMHKPQTITQLVQVLADTEVKIARLYESVGAEELAESYHQLAESHQKIQVILARSEI